MNINGAVKEVIKAEQGEKGISLAFMELGNKISSDILKSGVTKEGALATIFKRRITSTIEYVELQTTCHYINNTIDEILNEFPDADILQIRQNIVNILGMDAMKEAIYDKRVAEYKHMHTFIKSNFVFTGDKSHLGIGIVSSNRNLVYHKIVGDYHLKFHFNVDIGIRGKDKIGEFINASTNGMSSDEYLSLAMRQYGVRPCKFDTISLGISKKTDKSKDGVLESLPSVTRLVKLHVLDEHFKDTSIGCMDSD